MKTENYQKVLLKAMRKYIDLSYFCALGKQRKNRWCHKYLITQSLLMSYAGEATLTDSFQRARETLVAMYPNSIRPGRSYQSFIQARERIDGRAYDVLQQHLRCKHAALGTERLGWQAFAVDGTVHDVPRTKANQDYFGIRGKAKTHPQLTSTVLYNLAGGLPWAWTCGKARASERAQLDTLLPTLPEHALLVADAGFIGYDFIKRIVSQGRNFLFRVGANKTFLTDLGLETEPAGRHIVWLWPGNKRDQPPFKLRLIRLKSKSAQSDVYLVTNVLDTQKLSDKTAGVFYEMRWGIEVFFRDVKQTMKKKKLLSRSPEQALAEWQWAMMAMLLLGLMAVAAILSAGQDPLSWSVALALRKVRQAMTTRRRWRSRKDFHSGLVTLRDTDQRRSRKTARDYPRKKNDSPPKPPNIRKANRHEINRAKRLYDAA